MAKVVNPAIVVGAAGAQILPGFPSVGAFTNWVACVELGHLSPHAFPFWGVGGYLSGYKAPASAAPGSWSF